ncbi:MAG: hypothetical protein ABIR58_04230 [Gemmatimonadaceae bacterium]
MRRHGSTVCASLILLVAVDVVGAQGTLSTQGFGYPPGQYSTRVLATGGGLAQFDAETPLNPAAIALSADPRVFFQYEPEFRRFSTGAATANTVTARFPLTAASVPFGGKGSVGLSVSTFLDRSFATTTERDVTVADQATTLTETVRVLGAINDVRLAAGFAPSAKVQVGIGGHVFTGQNRVFFNQSFPDSLKFSTVTQASTLAFTGFAVSAGAIFRPVRALAFAVSGRKGGDISARSSDTTVSEASVPDRFAGAVSYEGIPGASFSAQVARESWSRLNGLGTASANAVDAWEGGLGLEAAGPRVAERLLVLRAGARYRTLPFQAAGTDVNELSFSGGLGAQFFRNRAAFDVTLQYSSRSASEAAAIENARERAFTLSFGLRVRP